MGSWAGGLTACQDDTAQKQSTGSGGVPTKTPEVSLAVFCKRRKGLLGTMAGFRAGPGRTQLNLGHLVVIESKKVIQKKKKGPIKS